LVQVRSFDARRLIGEVSEAEADELVRLGLCIEKLTTGGRRQYLRLVVPVDELPVRPSSASLITTRHVQGQRIPGADYGPDYYEHRYPDSVAITDRSRRKA
jgi:hypothetical protein